MLGKVKQMNCTLMGTWTYMRGILRAEGEGIVLSFRRVDAHDQGFKDIKQLGL